MCYRNCKFQNKTLKIRKVIEDRERENRSTFFTDFIECSSKTYLNSKMPPYSKSAKQTYKIQIMIQADMEVKDSVFGEVVVTLMKMLMRTKNKVTSRVIRPGMTSGGMTKLACKSP